MSYLSVLDSPIEAAAWASYMHRPGIVLPVVLAVVVFVIVFAGVRGVTETVVRKRGKADGGGYAAQATYIALGVALALAAAAAYAAPLEG